MGILNYNNFLLTESIIEFDKDLYGDLQSLKNLYKNDRDLNKLLTDFINIDNEEFESKKLPDSKYKLKPSKSIGRIYVGNNEYKIGKVLKILFPGIPNYQLEDFINKYKSHQKIKYHENKFELIKNGISEYYCMSADEIEEAGHVLNSCLVNKPDETFSFFEHNSNIEILVLKEHNKLIGRALVWTDRNGYKILDRIYYKEDYLVDVFVTYARNNGWYYRATSSVGNRYLSDPNGERVNDFHPIIKLEEYKLIDHLGLYPYLDTFTFLNLSKGELCNFDEWSEFDTVISLETDDGSFMTLRNLDIYLKGLFDKYNFVDKLKENYKQINWMYDKDLIMSIVDKDKISQYIFELTRSDIEDDFDNRVEAYDIEKFLKERYPLSMSDIDVPNDNLKEFLKSITLKDGKSGKITDESLQNTLDNPLEVLGDLHKEGKLQKEDSNDKEETNQIIIAKPTYFANSEYREGEDVTDTIKSEMNESGTLDASDAMNRILKQEIENDEGNVVEEFYKYIIGDVDKSQILLFMEMHFPGPKGGLDFLINGMGYNEDFLEHDTQSLANKFVIYHSDKSRGNFTCSPIIDILNDIL